MCGAGAEQRRDCQALDITQNTVKIHLRNILEKLHLQNRIQEADSAVHQHIVRDPYDIQP
jgi:DNA-binding NarL/FixJ family response regulator